MLATHMPSRPRRFEVLDSDEPHPTWHGRFPLGFEGGDPNLYRYVGNGVTYRTDPSGLTQAGNPLNNLFAGGYSGGTVSASKPLSTYVASGGLSLGTLGNVLGNAVYNAAASYAPVTTSIVSAGVQFFGGQNSQRGTYGPFPNALNPQVISDLRNQGRVTEPAPNVLSIRYTDSLGNDKKALVERHISGLGKAPAGQIRTSFDVINTAPIYVRDNDLAEIVLNNRKIRSLESVVGAANLGTAITPYVSDARDVIEFKTGRDAITHEPLTPAGRFLTGVGLALPVIGGVLFRKLFGVAEAPLRAGDPGRFSDLERRAVVGDNLTPHHMPQAALGFTSRADGGAIVLPTSQHQLTRTYLSRGAKTAVEDAGVPFRTILAKDIRDLRSIAGRAYNSSVQQLLDYYRQNFSSLITKPK